MIHDVALMMGRILANRAVAPMAAITHSQTIKARTFDAECGYDDATKAVGCERGVVVDTDERLSLVT